MYCNYWPYYESIIYRWEERGYVDRSVWEKAGECGLLGINIPEEHGGLGGSFAEASIVMDEEYNGQIQTFVFVNNLYCIFSGAMLV